ncbi:Ribosomal protein L30, ferredoxin-like fold domain [Ostreococcus tauri]|uniref:Large ribosomal subunit protein uL30m n=1 Tax=Ostreococcus tauri TaxID=70448 RepID=Q014N0_OSTTA|nr:Ribosomal protein L30, ferredoxin-like fold domain [Ostreococcus tauri]CAL54649.1 Ribosomal protein L30, ferredoxin-like fold domain [Ostreococcus tauri]|eukprot:XP_003080482.1 Ribosomal protein L30, ferredoxin-like fold domain [Ostreococcus tauri]
MSASHLLVTLRRGTAGKPKSVLSTLAALGLRRTRDAKIVPNDGGARGKLQQVKHLVRVETIEEAEKRLLEAQARRAVREPIRATH